MRHQQQASRRRKVDVDDEDPSNHDGLEDMEELSHGHLHTATPIAHHHALTWIRNSLRSPAALIIQRQQRNPKRLPILIGLTILGLLILSKLFNFFQAFSKDNYVSAFDKKPRMVVSLTPEQNKDTKSTTIARISPNDFTIYDRNPKLDTLSTSTFKWTWEHKKVDFIGKDYGDFQKLLSDSEDARERLLDPPPQGCVPQHDWQTQSFPTCNILHEQSLLDQTLQRHEKLLLGKGSYRSVWSLLVNNNQQQFALKTLNYDHDMTERRIERHRLDALIAERLTVSPYVLDMYAYCANSAVYTFASGGSLRDLIKSGALRKWSSSQKLNAAFQVAAAVADLHNIDHDGKASFIHGDIDTSQFVSTAENSNTFLLNDFNGGRLLYVDESKSSHPICPVKPSLYGGNHRSPEDYRGERVTENSDVYSMGNVLFAILTGRFPFAKYEYAEAQKRIMNGQRDKLPSNEGYKEDPRIQAIMDAIELAWKSDVRRRASARNVARVLQSAIYHNDESVD